MKRIAVLLSGAVLMFHAMAFELLENGKSFSAEPAKNLVVGQDGLLKLSPGAAEGELVSRMIDLGEGNHLRFLGWVASTTPKTSVKVDYRGSEKAPWQEARNSSLIPAGSGRFLQYRIRISRQEPAREPFLRELFISTKTLAEKFSEAKLERKDIPDLAMMMLYSVTPEKLYHVYSQLPYDASERGLYILRNAPDKTIGEDYRFLPDGNEMYLPMRYGTRILGRFHPVATFSALSLRPKDVILRSKDGKQEKAGLREQHRTVNFFDKEFLKEYRTGLRAAVRYYKENNPYLFGYTLMCPEFFYDTEPWPQMTFLSGFSPEALAAYKEFAAKLERPAEAWPAPSDGDILLDADSYLWAYWRSRAGADYIASLARIIKEENPAARVGTMHYVGAQSLRGLEPGFVELNPDFDFYYSSNLYPRVPGKDGLDGGTVFSRTRLNVEGHSRKRNVLEYDIWSPYVDAKRALTYARYAALEGVETTPIVLGDFPDNKPSNHLTRYHGMKGSPVTPELLGELAEHMREVKPLRTSKKFSQVAVVLPSISLHALLEKDRWLPHRLTQQELHVLKPLLELNVAFDFLTEGYVTKELLDNYKLVIVSQAAIYPWMRKALEETKADILALGWAGSVSAPGPARLLAPIEPEQFDFTLTHGWPRESAGKGKTFFGGELYEDTTIFNFSDNRHALLDGLRGITLLYSAPGLQGKPLPYAAGMKGEVLVTDVKGNPVYTVEEKERKIICFGGLPWQLTADGGEKQFFTPEQEKRFFRNIMAYCGIEHYPESGALRLMRNRDFLLVENTSEQPFKGTLPKAANPARKLPETALEIPALGSVVIPLR